MVENVTNSRIRSRGKWTQNGCIVKTINTLKNKMKGTCLLKQRKLSMEIGVDKICTLKLYTSSWRREWNTKTVVEKRSNYTSTSIQQLKLHNSRSPRKARREAYTHTHTHTPDLRNFPIITKVLGAGYSRKTPRSSNGRKWTSSGKMMGTRTLDWRIDHRH